LASTAKVADGETALARRDTLDPVAFSEVDVTGAMIPYVTDPLDIKIPSELLPGDGRFGCGPSKVRREQVSALAAAAPHYLGTSHRQKTVKSEVGRLRAGLSELFSLPKAMKSSSATAHHVLLDAATFGLIEHKSQHLSFGEFSSKFASCAKAAPHLEDPTC